MTTPTTTELATPSATERNLDAPDGGATFGDQPMGPGKLRPPVAVNVNVQ